MPVKFIHTADIHMGMKLDGASFGGKTATLRRREIRETFFGIVEAARQKSVDFLLISGDLFENEYISPGELKDIRGALNSLKDTHVIITPGNHDHLKPGLGYRLVDFGNNVHISPGEFSRYEFSSLGTDIYTMSWDRPYISGRLAALPVIENPERINILVIHADAAGPASAYLPIDTEMLKSSGFDYIALGHIHKPGFISRSVAYPGSPEPLDFSETGKHGYISGELEKGRCEAHFIPSAKREFKTARIKLEPSMTYSEVLFLVRAQADPVNLVRLILTGTYDRDIDLSRLHEESEEGFFHFEIKDEAEPDFDIDKLYEENKGNIIGEFITEMRSRDLSDELQLSAFRLGLSELIRYRRDPDCI